MLIERYASKVRYENKKIICKKNIEPVNSNGNEYVSNHK